MAVTRVDSEPSRERVLSLRRAAIRAGLRASRGPARGLVLQRELGALRALTCTLGQRPRSAIRRIARRSSQRLLIYDQLWSTPEAWPRFSIEGREHLEAAVAGGRGVILAPAHFGPYRWLSIALLELGLHVTLLVDARNQTLVDSDVAARMKPIFPKLDWSVFETVNSADPLALVGLVKALRRGRAVVMFIDGNSGMNGRLDPRGALRLDLLGREILVRPGIAALSASADVPILPIYIEDAGERGAILRIEPPIARAPKEGRKIYRARAMTTLFSALERWILAAPERWEEWWLLSRWFATPPDSAAPSTPAGAEAIRLALPALVGSALEVGRPELWRLDESEGQARVVDVLRGDAFELDPATAGLFSAAERGTSATSWMRAQESLRHAKRTLGQALEVGLVRLVRAP